MNTASSRNWFPVILAGLTVVLAVIFYATNRSVDMQSWVASWTEQKAELPVVEPAPTEDEYKAAVRTIFATYTAEGDAQSAYNAFVQLHVPGSMQAFHIDLIITFGKLAVENPTKNPTEGQARLDALLAQHSWLTM